MNEYDKNFNSEIESILNELYKSDKVIGGAKIKRERILTEKKYVDFLEDIQLIKRIQGGDGDGKWAMQLEFKGYEVIEKYGGWKNYKRKVIDKNFKMERAKYFAQRFWWLAALFTVISILVTIFLKNQN